MHKRSRRTWNRRRGARCRRRQVHQELEQAEAEGASPAVDEDFVSVVVDPKAAALVRAVRAIAVDGPGAPEHRAHAGDELAGTEREGDVDVVVRAAREPGDPEAVIAVVPAGASPISARRLLIFSPPPPRSP
jgi:hypothetical protein